MIATSDNSLEKVHVHPHVDGFEMGNEADSEEE